MARLPGHAAIPATVTVTIEVPRWSFVKRKLDRRIDFVSPLPSPYNYGSVEDTLAPDGDPLDAIVLGPRLPLGARWEGPVQAVYLFLDDGQPDPKLICSRAPLRATNRRGVEAFFRTYAWMKRGLYVARGRRGPTRALGFSDWAPGAGPSRR